MRFLFPRYIKLKIFNRAIRILLVTNAVLLLATAMLGPIVALFVEDIGGNLLDASISLGLFAAAAGVTTFFSGRLTDRMKEKELITVSGYLIMGIAFLLFLFADSIWTVFVLQMLLGVGEALYAPSFDTLFSAHASPRNVGRAWGTWESARHISAAIWAFLGGIIASVFGFDAVFVITAFLCIGSATYIYFLPRKVL